MGLRTIFVAAGLLLLAPCGVLGQDAQEIGPTVRAARTVDGIAIDGRLEEADWNGAVPATEFRQLSPDEGAPPTQPTEVRVLFGANSLFIGARLYDDRPEDVEPALGRRDELNRADWFLVSIDSYFDRRTAYTFGINAAGVQFDAVRSGGDDFDDSWDAVWYSAARTTSDGWVAELRIPYTMLRFSEENRQTWGIHFARRIPRLGEESEWPLVRRTERGNFVAGFGLLEGISGVEPGRNIQLRPYAVTRVRTLEDPDASGSVLSRGNVDAGGDLKVGIGSNVTLDATINPDFGQVESDPAVLNLSAFETSFDERRPFFVEGIQIYQFSAGPGQLLYTRRIGATAPILGAAKLSGRTSRGLSFGLLGASTANDFESYRHYGVARATQQIGSYSSIGGIVTGFSRPAVDRRSRSLVAGADWDLRFGDNAYGVEGFASITDRRGYQGGPETGVAAKTWLRKRRGTVKGFLGLDMFGDEFNPNDLGQLNENNFFAILNNLVYDIAGGRAFGPFQRAGLEYFFVQQIAYDSGLNLGQMIDFESSWIFRGFQEVELGVVLEDVVGGYDLYETRGLGPWADPFEARLNAEFTTDERRSWQVEPGMSLYADEAGGRGRGVQIEAAWNAGSQLALDANVELERTEDVTSWSSNETFRRTEEGWMIGTRSDHPASLGPDEYRIIDDPGRLADILEPLSADADGNYYVPVFGERDTRALDVTLRGTYTFLPDLSLQFYGQLFLARGRYERFQLLQSRDDLVPYDAFPKRNNFSFSSLQSNVVLRWEYRPGSTLFVVWTHGRRTDDRLAPLGPWGPSPYEASLSDRIGDTFGVIPENVFLVKLNYTFLY